MTSSTSSFRSEWKVIVSVVGALIVAAVCFHFGEPWLSQDIRHIRQIPAIVKDLEVSPAPRVLFLSNSLTHVSIQPEIISATWVTAGFPRVSIGRIFPDDTNIADWIYVYRRYVPPGLKLDLLVVTFANNQLADTTPNYERIGGYGGLSSAPQAFAEDIPSLDGRVRYLLGATSGLWLNRERVQSRILALVQGYKALVETVNRFEHENTTADGSKNHHATYNRLARFLRTVTQNGTQVVFVAAPIPTRYDLPDDLRRTIHAFGGQLVNMQGFEQAGPGEWPDGYHLSPEAAERFSHVLAVTLANEQNVVPGGFRAVGLIRALSKWKDAWVKG
jgi:hypothetical protein